MRSGSSAWSSRPPPATTSTRRGRGRSSARSATRIYGVFCDRLGASSFTEDLTGASYNAICHYDAQGNYGNQVDVSALPPPVTPAEKEARQLSVAKLERMAQRRGNLVHALNAVFPDVKIPDVTSKAPGAQVGLHDALMTFAQKLTPLYESNPIVPKGQPLLPSQTRALGRLFSSMGAVGTCSSGGSKACTFDADCGAGATCRNPVRDALSHMWGRRGYRPYQVGLGVVRPALAYPDLRSLTKSAISLLAPGGSAANELQQVFTVLKQEMATAKATVSPLPTLVVDTSMGQPNRPRSDMEFASALFLTQSSRFSTGGPSSYIALRDRRGFVVPAGNVPGQPGTVMAPFVDNDDDGYADVDAFGRFLGTNGAPLALDPPFVIPEETAAAPDPYGRPTTSASSYSYLDTSQTMVGGLAHSLIPLVNPLMSAPAGDPNAWMQENETLMYALAGAYDLYGSRSPKTYDYSQEGPNGKVVSYSAFNADESPLPNLIHAAGQVLADKDSDALLLSLLDLLKNHESTVARLMGAALRLREIAKQHDQNAAMGLEPKAGLAYDVPIWDQMAQVVWTITKKPGLMKALIGALADPTVVTSVPATTGQTPDTQNMGDALARFVKFKDHLSYNPRGTHYDGSSGGINGPAVNLTVDPGGNDTSDPHTPVDFTSPRTGDNISCMQRSLKLIHDANGGPACNKDGATVASKIGPISLTWPITGFPLYASPYGECQLFKFDNLASFYLDSLLPANHPKRAYLQVLDTTLNQLLGYLSDVGISTDSVLEQSSDIAGLTTHPESYALNRLVFFGSSTNNPNYNPMPDLDMTNKGTQVDAFISGSLDPVSCAWCPPDGNGVPTCTDKNDTVRLQDPDGIFLWERLGFTQYLQPVVVALANSSPSDESGEAIFGQMIDVLWQHWPNGSEVSSVCPQGDSLKCSGAGVNKYEPILADSFDSDLIPALNEFANVAYNLSQITVQRGPSAGQVWTGADVLEKITTILFSQDYAASVNMVDRKGSSSATWTDGTHQNQLTVFNLFADALHKIDTSFADACKNAGSSMTACLADATARQGQWKRARSQLVDEFLAVDTSGATPVFKNPSTTPTLIATLELAREQTNAHCPSRESGVPCTWAKSGLDTELAGVIGRPLFAALVDMMDKLRQDEPSRRALESFLEYVLEGANDGGASLQGLLASNADIMQTLLDDADLSPIIDASATGVAPDADPAGPGAGSMSIDVLKALTDDAYDPYHVMDHVLPLLVTPMDGGANVSPIEIFMDVISDVNRIDASSTGAFAPDDYEAVMSTMNGFMIDKTRGLEQLYTIIQKRPNQ